jgi:hypothetical protein
MNELPKKFHRLKSFERRLAHPILHLSPVVVQIHHRERRSINPRVLHQGRVHNLMILMPVMLRVADKLSKVFSRSECLVRSPHTQK